MCASWEEARHLLKEKGRGGAERRKGGGGGVRGMRLALGLGQHLSHVPCCANKLNGSNVARVDAIECILHTALLQVAFRS